MKYRLFRWGNIILHKFNLHHTRTFYPEGDTVVRCDWCGLQSVMKRKGWKDAISLKETKSQDNRKGEV